VYCDFGSHILIIEVDKNQHSNYSCENKRIMEISQDFNHRSCVFIRFNPDTYIDKKIQSCFVVKKDTGKVEIRCEKELDRRMNELDRRMNELKKEIEGFVSNITVITSELFYNY
jgi:hypothetical protein